MQPITPCLWFDHSAEEAAQFYVSIFRDSEILSTEYYNEANPDRKGQVLIVHFTVQRTEFCALNAGPEFKFTPATSFMIDCPDQAEVDRLWDLLGQGGRPMSCGWVTDKFGVTWQVIPRGISELIKDPVVMSEMMTMEKLDIERLREVKAQRDAAV